MVIIYDFGNVDERECVDLECTSLSVHAKFRGVKIGDIVEVVKGRKYTIGDEIEVADVYSFTLPYGRDTVDYIFQKL